MSRAVPETHFGNALIRRVRELGHPLCVGLDPHLERIPELFRRGSMAPADPNTALAVEDFLVAVLERVARQVAIVKPQSAFFEQLGWPGIKTLAHVVTRAQELGLLVLLDAKRGDMGSTAEAYARAYLSNEAPLPVDALTLNPYLGLETLEPYARAARATGRGMFVLTKTSNPGSGDYQDREFEGRPLYEVIAASLRELADELAPEVGGWSSLGLIVGATYPTQAAALRSILPKALFLVPGYGAQGGSAQDSVRGFVPGPAGLEGGIVSSSRGVLYPPGAEGADPATWEKALDAAVEEAAAALSEAIR
jgi:orotidine-5'-phosphate decarboxylase